MYNAHKINYTYANICYEHRPLNGIWIDGVNYDDEKNEAASELAALRRERDELLNNLKAAEIALTDFFQEGYPVGTLLAEIRTAILKAEG